MTPEQAERMASARNNNRDLRMLMAAERQAAALEGIQQELGMIFYKLFEENCAEQITELLTAPNAEVRMKEKAD